MCCLSAGAYVELDYYFYYDALSDGVMYGFFMGLYTFGFIEF